MFGDAAFFEEEVFCPECNKLTFSIIEKRGGNAAWFCCALLSLAGGACFFPFFVSGCLDSDIYCIECSRLKRVDEAAWMF